MQQGSTTPQQAAGLLIDFKYKEEYPMPSFTRREIKRSFIKLLNEQSLNKISVKDIVEECGVNRNSFYYHFRDIPEMIEEILMEQLEVLIEKYPKIESLHEFVDSLYEIGLENQKVVLHIFNSVNRGIFERFAMQLCENAVTKYINTTLENRDISEGDRRICIMAFKYELFGCLIECCTNGLKKKYIEDIHRLIDLCQGVPELIVKRSREKG